MDSQNNAVERYYNKKKKRRKKRKIVFYTLLFIFSITVVTILSLTVFFNISNIEVTGNSYYNDSKLISVSGLEKGDNLFRINKFKLIDKIKAELPYLNNVKIDRHLPVGIEIIVEETSPYLYIESNGAYYLLNESLKVLEKTKTLPKNLPAVTGITPENLEINTVMTAKDGMDSYLLTLTDSLKTVIGDGCVTGVYINALYDMGFEYKGRIKVMLGTLDKIDVKLLLAEHVIKENESNETAEIDVSNGKRAYYRSVSPTENEQTEPETEPETETETDTETEQNTEQQTEE